MASTPEKVIANYNSIMELAKESAKKQIAQLVNNVAVSENDINIEVNFLSE